MENKNHESSLLWILELVSPLTVHLFVLTLIYVLTIGIRVRSGQLRRASGILLVNLIVMLGYFKTRTDENLYRVLRTDRTPSIRDIQIGLDRLESTLDEDAVADLENKLTGKTSSYYLKGKFSSRRS